MTEQTKDYNSLSTSQNDAFSNLESAPELSRPTVLNKLLEEIQQDPRYQAGLPYGKVRKGHPEGSIELHIKEVTENVELLFKLATSEFKYDIPPTLRLELLIVSHVHDTFKGSAKKGVRIDDPESHASLARSFLGEFTGDPRLLACVQNHDVPFSIYRNHLKFGSFGQERLNTLVQNMPDLNLFTLFQIVDNTTLGKLPKAGARSATHWFIEQIAEHLPQQVDYQGLLAALVKARNPCQS
jgi:hypothetical protein